MQATAAVYKGSEICEQFKSNETFGRIKEEVERKHKDWTRFEVWPYPSEDEFFPIPIWTVEKKMVNCEYLGGGGDMSNFYCPQCGETNIDSPDGYVKGCDCQGDPRSTDSNGKPKRTGIKIIFSWVLYFLGCYEIFINGNKGLGLLWIILAYVAIQIPVEIKFVGKNKKEQS